MTKRQADAISRALIYLLESMPNYEKYSDYSLSGLSEVGEIIEELEIVMGELE